MAILEACWVRAGHDALMHRRLRLKPPEVLTESLPTLQAHRLVQRQALDGQAMGFAGTLGDPPAAYAFGFAGEDHGRGSGKASEAEIPIQP